jgi:hypothetical protein
MFKRIWILAIVVLAAAGAALSAPEAKRELDPTELAKGKVARQVFDQIIARYRNGEGYDVDDLALWSQRILVADLAASADAEQRRTAYEAHQARTSDIEKIAGSYFRAGMGRQSDALAAEYYRLDAESQLANIKRP